MTMWNWKSAVLSAGLRGAIFFATNLTFGIDAAWRALFVDSLFRLPLVGFYGAITQALKDAQPRWAATLAAVLLVPGLAHGVEFAVHWAAGTPAVRTSVLVSIAFSTLSTVFNLFAMRRGVLLVGAEGRSFAHDLRRLPGLVVDFLCLGLRGCTSGR